MLEFLKSLNKNKTYEVKLPRRDEDGNIIIGKSFVSKITLLDSGWVKVKSPKGVVTIVNLANISYVKRSTKMVYEAHIPVPQSVLHWLWTNLQVDKEYE